MALYSCWIGNIPKEKDCEYYEDKLKDYGKQFGNVVSCSVTENTTYSLKQCYLNYDQKNSAEQAVIYFNNIFLFGTKLLSQYRGPKQTDATPLQKPRSTSCQKFAPIQTKQTQSKESNSDSWRRDPTEKQTQEKESNSDSWRRDPTEKQTQSKELRSKSCQKDPQTEKRRTPIEEHKIDIIDKFQDKAARLNYAGLSETKMLTAQLFRPSRSKQKSYKQPFQPPTVEPLAQQNSITKQERKNNENSISFETYCEKRMNLRKEIEVQENFDVLINFLNEPNFKRKFHLQNLNIECEKPGKIIFTGKQSDFNNSKYHQLNQFGTRKETTKPKSKKLRLSFLRNKLSCYKRELLEKFIKFEFESDISSFTLYGYVNEFDEIVIKINNFINRAENVSISVIDKKYDGDKIKKIIANNFKSKQNESLNGFDVYFDEKNKIIFINGTDKEEIDEIKVELTNLIDELIEKSVAVKIPLIIYDKLIQSGFLMNAFKENTQVSLFSQRNPVRISGNASEIALVKSFIMHYCELLSKQIRVTYLEINKFEYAYLESSKGKQKEEINAIMKNKNVNICIDAFERYASLKISNVDIELLYGDLTKYPADVYVNAANKQLNHAGGLAKVIVECAGSNVNELCSEHVEKNGELGEGEVFVTEAGGLSWKSSTYIMHAVGPIWTGGNNNEKENLARSVINCLKEAVSRHCESIVIPPISTGIFNYPFIDAATIITEAVFDFVSKKQSCLRKVVFLTNENEAVKKWEVVMKHQAISKNIEVKTSSKFSLESSKWFWKDDEGKWKAYIDKYNSFIDDKYKEYEKTGFNISKSTFDLEINGKLYSVDLNKKLQINKSNAYKHEISNQVPVVSQYYWTWLDDGLNHSPLSEKNSYLVEEAYIQKKKSIDLIVKKHKDDIDTPYRYEFALNNDFARDYLASEDQNADGIQTNLVTKFKRPIFREMRNVAANIQYENEETEDEPLKQIIIAGFDVDGAKKDILELLINAKISETLPNYDIPKDQIEIISKKYYCEIDVSNDTIMIKGMSDAVGKAKMKILELSITINTLKHIIHYPKEWVPQSDDLFVVPLVKNTEEYKKVHDEVAVTIPNPKLVKIERIQNKWLWKQYSHHVKTLKDKGVDENEKWLFHGTSSCEPKQIYDDPFGFDMRLSNNGMWGRGIYFAVNASYSRSYVYSNSDGTSSMFYARVALGDAVQLPSASYSRPPEKPANMARKLAKCYDSIKGNTGGSDIYILYENLRAYPEYLITFEKN